MHVTADNLSFVLHGVENVKYEDVRPSRPGKRGKKFAEQQRPIPKISRDQVLVRIEKTGICGSDVHYLQHGRIGTFVLEEPMCLGHESSGTIVQLGEGVLVSHRLRVGMRVALEPGVSCRTCHACKCGSYELCPQMSFAATPPSTFGTLARYYVLPADLCHRIPDSVSFENGAMIEPLAVGVHSVGALGKCKSNQIVIVFGCGPVGLLCMAVARALGARRVIAVDVNTERLDFAKTYAATDVHRPLSKEGGEDPDVYAARAAEALRTELGIPALGFGAIDLAIDATGAPPCIAMAMHLLKPAGTMVAVGMGSTMNIPVSFFQIISKQLNVVGSFRYGTGDYELAISLVERGLVDPTPLITHRYRFEEALAAFEATKAGKGLDGKPVIKCIIDGPE